MSEITYYQFDKIAKFIDYRGKTPKKTESGIPLITAKNIKFGYLSVEPKEYISEDDYDSWMSRGIPKKGNILFTTEAPLGNVCILDTDEKRAFAQRAIIFQPLDENTYISKYLFYYMMSNIFKDELDSKKTGTTVKGIKSTILKKFQIPLPSFSEQQRIVSKLDNLFEKIDKAIVLHQKNIDEADVFMGSVLNDVFDELKEKYEFIKINDTVIKTNNQNPKNNAEKPFTYIDISSIDNNLFQIVEPKQLIGKDAPSRAKKEILFGDVVYSTTRPNLKNIAIVNKKYDNPIASTGFCVLRVNDNTINSYLFYYLTTDKLFEQIEPNIRGAQYPATSDKDLKNCNIPNTPYNIQQKVVKYLDEVSEKIEKAKLLQKEKKENLKALKASILDKAFRGEL